MSNHYNEVFYENLREQILDTNVIDLVWEIHDQGTTSSDGRPDAITLEAIAKSNEDLFIEYFEGFVSFPTRRIHPQDGFARITMGEFIDFLEEMAEHDFGDSTTPAQRAHFQGLKIDIEEVYEILNRELDKRAEEAA